MTLAEKKLLEKKKLRDISIDIIILSAIGIIGLVASIVLAVLPDIVGPIAIVVAIISCTALILVGIEGIHKTIVENSLKS